MRVTKNARDNGANGPVERVNSSLVYTFMFGKVESTLSTWQVADRVVIAQRVANGVRNTMRYAADRQAYETGLVAATVQAARDALAAFVGAGTSVALTPLAQARYELEVKDAVEEILGRYFTPLGGEANFGGNIDCTPPCKTTDRASTARGAGAGPREYKLGRIFHGRVGVHAALRGFLEAQRVQAPFDVDVSWLKVGHVDELMSFIPAAQGTEFRRWRLLLASPQKALDLITTVNRADPQARMLVGRELKTGNALVPVEMDATLMSGGGFPTLIRNSNNAAMTSRALCEFNQELQERINVTRQELVNEIGLTPDLVIDVPVLFQPAPNNKATAITANMVNMVVVNGHCIVPKPFGPMRQGVTDVFEEELTARITAANANLTVHYVDDWDTYHVGGGEVHCGTNVARRPAQAQMAAWLAQAGTAWWLSDP